VKSHTLLFVSTLASVLALGAAPASANSLRFYGNNNGSGTTFIDRVEISVDSPATPADIGATDFTIELWLKPTTGNNAPGGITNWIDGNIFLDRDRFNQSRAFGASLSAGRVAFGIVQTVGAGQVQQTWRGTSDIRDGSWHHIVIQRTVSTGVVQIYVDGVREENSSGPTGDISFPDGGGGGIVGKDPFLVLGAEKHDANPSQFVSYFGYMTELRLSNFLRYSGATIVVPTTPLSVDANTVALYHFADSPGMTLFDADGGQSPGTLRRGGTNNGPTWETDSPFAASPGALQFSSATFNVTEGTANAPVSVTRSGGSMGAASVSVTITPGTATQGADYNVPANTTLNWGDSVQGAQTLPVPIIDDANPESTETVSLALSGASGAGLGSTTTATLNIADNDTPPSPGSLQFSTAAASVGESAGSATLTVNRVSGSLGVVSVAYASANGSATAGQDYTAVTNTLTFADGDVIETISVPILDDGTDEANENFAVTLSNPMGGATLGTPVTSTVTINDNDAAPVPGTLQFRAGTASIAESGGSVALIVDRVSGSDGSVTVNYATADVTATAGADYTAASATLTFGNGITSQTINIAVTDDTADESNESFRVALSNPTGGATTGAPSSATVTISDNDSSPPASGSSGGGASDPWLLLVGVLLLAVRRHASRSSNKRQPIRFRNTSPAISAVA